MKDNKDIVKTFLRRSGEKNLPSTRNTTISFNYTLHFLCLMSFAKVHPFLCKRQCLVFLLFLPEAAEFWVLGCWLLTSSPCAKVCPDLFCIEA